MRLAIFFSPPPPPPLAFARIGRLELWSFAAGAFLLALLHVIGTHALCGCVEKEEEVCVRGTCVRDGGIGWLCLFSFGPWVGNGTITGGLTLPTHGCRCCMP